MINRLLERVGIKSQAPLKNISFGGTSSVYPLGFYPNDNRDLDYSKIGAAASFTFVPEVNNAIGSIVGGIESLPWDVIKYPKGIRRENRRAVEGVVLASDDDLQNRHPFQRALQQFQRLNNFSLMGVMAYDYTLYGECALEVASNQYGYNSRIEWLNPLGLQVYAQREIINFRFGWNTTFITYDPDEICYLHNRNPFNDFTGYPQVLAVMDKINISRNTDRFLRDYFINNARPGLIIMPDDSDSDFSTADHDAFKNQFREQMKGVGGQYNTWITSRKVTAQALEQPDLVRNSQLSREQADAIYEKFSVPRAMRGNTSATPYKDGDETTRRFYLDAVLPLAKILQEFINVELMPYFDHDTGLEVFEFDTSGFDMVTEADMQEAQVIDVQLRGGIIDLYTAALLQERPADERLKGLYMIEGIPIPIDQLSTYWEKKLLVAPSVYNAPEVTGEPLPEPAKPDEVIPTQDGGSQPVSDEFIDEALEGGVSQSVLMKAVATDSPNSYAVIGRFSDTRQIELIQTTLRSILHKDTTYIPESDFHVTLLYSEDALFADIQDSLAINQGVIPVIVDGINAFETPDGYAVHLTIRNEASLFASQSALAQVAIDHDVELSPYSKPDNWKPHITLCYAVGMVNQFDFKPFTLLIDRIEVSGGADHETLITHNLKADSHDHTHDWQTALYDGIESENDLDKRIKSSLKAWKTYALRRFGTNKAHEIFTPNDAPMPLYIRHAVITALDTCKSHDDIQRVFATVMDNTWIKSINTYARALRELALALWKDDITPSDFRQRMGDRISNSFDEAFISGVEDGGLTRDDLDGNELDDLTRAINEEKTHVANLADWIEAHNRSNGGKQRDVFARVDRWVASYQSVKDLGYLIAKRDTKTVWKYDPRKEHCKSCKALNGQVRRASFWRKMDIRPKSTRLECFGIHCGCTIEDTDEPVTKGKLPNLYLRD